MILVFKQIYNPIILRKTMNVVNGNANDVSD